MNSLPIDFVSSSVWIVSSALSLVLLLVVILYHLYLRSKIGAITKDGRDAAALAAHKESLKAQIAELNNRYTEQKEQLETLDSERDKQEKVRQKLFDSYEDLASLNMEKENLNDKILTLKKSVSLEEKNLQEIKNTAKENNEKIEQLQEQNNSIKNEISRNKEELAESAHKMEAVRQELNTASQELTSLNQDRKKISEELSSLKNSIDNEKTALEELKSTIRAQEEKKAQLQKENTEIENRIQENEGMRQESARKAEEMRQELSTASQELASVNQDRKKVSEELSSLKNSIDNEKTALEELKSTIRAQEEKKAQLQKENTEIENRIQENEGMRQESARKAEEMRQESLTVSRELEAIRQEREKLSDKIKDLQETIASEESTLETVKDRKRDKEFEITQFQDKLDTIKKELQEYDEKHQEYVHEKEEWQYVRRTLDEMRQEVQSLTAFKATLEVEIEKLKGELAENGGANTQDGAADAYADIMEVDPVCLAPDEFAGAGQVRDEVKLLHEFRDVLAGEGYYFPERVINAFHTSLKSNVRTPLTVLAGVSGTGKTLLPIRYTEFMGLHRLVIAVQPRWDSPQDMFGFYNYLEKRYKGTELSRALVRMDPYNYDQFASYRQARDGMLLVLLDEMNLARTEYYFSEFLSKLELRRLVKNPSVAEQRHQAELNFDAGPGGRPFTVWVPENVLFVGTMNEDETTQALSDKVLDRSNVLRFGKPASVPAHERHAIRKASQRREYLPFSTWQSWMRSAKDRPWESEVNQWIDRINEAMNGVGRPFGFRVREGMLSYVANYPGIDDVNRYRLAFADQIEQKILPKLRGIDMSEAGTTLSRIAEVIRSVGDDALEESFREAQQESARMGLFTWRGVTRAFEDD